MPHSGVVSGSPLPMAVDERQRKEIEDEQRADVFRLAGGGETGGGLEPRATTPIAGQLVIANKENYAFTAPCEAMVMSSISAPPACMVERCEFRRLSLNACLEGGGMSLTFACGELVLGLSAAESCHTCMLHLIHYGCMHKANR